MLRRILNGMIFVALAALAAGQLPAVAQVPGKEAAGTGDERAVRENVRQLEAGWNTRSGALFAKPFAEDADYVIINGMHIRGREAIDKGHQRIFDTIYKDSALSLVVRQVRFIRPDVALVHVAGHNKVSQNGETRESDGMITLVMTREKGEWKIVAFQNTQVMAPAGR